MLEIDESLRGEQSTDQRPIIPTEREFTVKERSQWQMAWRRFLKHRMATASLVVFILLLLFAFVLPHFWKFKYNGNFIPVTDLNQPPSLKHPFGTDSTRDQLAVVMRGTGQSLKVAFLIASVGTGLGALWGVVAGFLGGIIDSALMRLADLVLTIPALALAAALHRTWRVSCAVSCCRCVSGSSSKRPARWARPTCGSCSGTCCRTRSRC
jgi:ABC-type dipeptide/oligopeptide/nickel transport system permease subunit